MVSDLGPLLSDWKERIHVVEKMQQVILVLFRAIPYPLPFGKQAPHRHASMMVIYGHPVLHHATEHMPSATTEWASSIDVFDPITSVVLRKLMQDNLSNMQPISSKSSPKIQQFLSNSSDDRLTGKGNHIALKKSQNNYRKGSWMWELNNLGHIATLGLWPGKSARGFSPVCSTYTCQVCPLFSLPTDWFPHQSLSPVSGDLLSP